MVLKTIWPTFAQDSFAIMVPTSIWIIVVYSSSFESGWFSFLCSGPIGFFLLLTSSAYGEKRFASMTLVGIFLSGILSISSGIYALRP
ncbi:MAG: hypothetical protein EB152_02765 [Euryarchaeota archaeon]|nr:hypothetical protein [Euryarchaeota archaeon]